jgi:oligopeptide transport system substrate-binding protein|nr:peptide ABC transporter substrate-binding protein [Kandleria vitulina]
MRKVGKIVAVALAASLLAGCGSGTKTDSSTFRFASELDIMGMDSSVIDDGMSFTAIHAITEGLMGNDKDGKTEKAVAKDYKVSDDRKTYTFTLRDDAKWSNGDDVTADDFVYAWKRIIKNAGNYAYMLGSEGANVKNADALIEKGTQATDKELDTLGVKATDKKTLVVELEAPVPYFLDLMTFPCYYPINQKFAEKAGKKYATTPDNTLSNGAFVMSKWTKGKSAEFTKNDKYYNKDAVKIKTLHMDLGMKPQSASASFDSKKVDYATISSDLVDKYKGKDVYQSFNEGYLWYLEPNHVNKDLANANIRKALSYAINRKSLCTDVLKDGSKEAEGFIPAELSQSPDGKDFRKVAGSFTSYDVKKAQEAFDQGLKELGKKEITLELLYGSDESPADKVAEYIQTNFSKIKGLKIDMKTTTKQDRINNRMKNGKFDLALTRWGPDYADPTTYLNLMSTGNANNYGKYENKTYNSLMKQIQTETNVDKRYDLMVKAEKTAMDEMANIPVFEKGGSALQVTNVSGLVHKPVGVPYTFTYVEVK